MAKSLTKTSRSRDRAVDLLLELLAIPGGSGDEARVAEFVTGHLLRSGAEPAWIASDSTHRRTPHGGNTGNLVLKLPGQRRQPRRLLMAHLDTVPVCVGASPVKRKSFIRSGDPARGIGADNRAGVAVVLLTALEVLQSDHPHPPLTFLWTVQEEVGLQGCKYMSVGQLGKPQMAFNFDGGSAAKLTIGATGGYRMEIEIAGIASHAGGAPELGVSAISIASLAIAELTKRGWHGDVRKGKHRGTSNFGVIHGGQATNVVADQVRVQAEARSHDPVFRQQMIDEIEAAFEHACDQVASADGRVGKVAIRGRLDYESFMLGTDEPAVRVAEAAVEACGRVPEQAVSNGGLDANWMVAHGIPTVTLGCGQLNQHMTSEALDLTEFHAARGIARHLAFGQPSA